MDAPFGNPEAVRKAKAANLAYKRAKDLDYTNAQALLYARTAKKESTDWEAPADTALRIVQPKRARQAGHGGGRVG